MCPALRVELDDPIKLTSGYTTVSDHVGWCLNIHWVERVSVEHQIPIQVPIGSPNEAVTM
jgi:hypothetical protein